MGHVPLEGGLTQPSAPVGHVYFARDAAAVHDLVLYLSGSTNSFDSVRVRLRLVSGERMRLTRPVVCAVLFVVSLT